MARYKFYLRESATSYFSVDGSGAIVSTPTKKHLAASVINWNDITYTWKRHSRFPGVFRRVSTSGGEASVIKFANDAAKILRHLYHNRGGVMAACQFYVEIEQSAGAYAELYTGDIDFSTYQSLEHWVELSILESGLSAMLNAYENTLFEIPIETTDAVSILMDGVDLKTQYRFVNVPHNGTVTNTQQNDKVDLTFTRQIGDLSACAGNSVSSVVVGDQEFLVCNYATDIKIHYDFEIEYTVSTNDNGIKLRYETWTGAPGSTTRIDNDDTWAVSPITPAGNTNRVRFTGTITPTHTLQPGNTVTMWIDIQTIGSTSAVDYSFLGYTLLTVDCVTSTGAAAAEDNIRLGYRWWQVFYKLINKITNGAYLAASNYLTNPGLLGRDFVDATPYHTAIISEQSLKQLVTTPAIKVKLAELYQDALAGMHAGIGIENEVVIVEQLSHFYRKNQVIGRITGVNDFTYEHLADAIFNTAEFGYDGGDAIDEINKTNSFNTKHVVTSSITRVKDSANQVWDMVRPFPADPNYIELVRMQNPGNSVVVNNTKRDDSNRNFLVYLSQLQSSGAYELMRYPPDVTGIDNPDTAYNMAISPARCKLRCAPLIKSKLYGLNDKKLKFQTAEQNKTLRSRLSYPVGFINESDDVDFNTVPGDELFKPVVFRFNGVPPKDLATMMNTSPYGVLEFEYRGVLYKGYVLSAGINPGKLQTYSFELLSSPDNDLSKLVY